MDIGNSLDKITDLQDLLGAQGELRDRHAVLELLQSRLTESRAHEAKQAELQQRSQLERDRDAAKAEHAELDNAFESVLLDIETYLGDRLGEAFDIAQKRGNASARHAQALYELRGNQTDWSGSSELSESRGWVSKATPDGRTPIREALRALYLNRNGSSSRPALLAPPVSQKPDTSDSFRQQIVAEYTARNG